MIWRVVLTVGMVYEAIALWTRRVPTISKIAQTAHEHPIGRFLVWTWAGAWAWHFMEPQGRSEES